MEKIIDGVLYRITECDNIEIFADRKLYLAISDTTFFNENAFLYDETTGLLSENTVYEGTNVLFPIQLDASKADPKKAKEYLEQLDKEWDSEEESSKESTTVKKSSKNLRIQQETFVDEENGITFHLPKYDSDYEKWGGQSWSANEESSNAVFRYRFQVEGEGIDTLTYTLNQGKLGDFPRNEYDDWKVYDNPYTISYEEQENIDNIYHLQFIGKFADYGYDKDYMAKLGVTDIEERSKIEYEVLKKAIASTTLNLDIKMKDGRTITKILTFKNVLSNDGKHSVWIQVDVKD